MALRPGTAWALAVLASLSLACCLPVPEETGGPSEPPSPRGLLKREPPSADGGTQVLHFTWEDPNTVPVLERRGDTFVTDARVRPERYSVIYRMDLERLRWASESYGVPDDWVELRWGNEEEREAVFEEARNRSAARGIRLEMEGDSLQISPDGNWIVQNSRRDLEPLTRSLYGEALTRGHRDQREFLGVAASFVQGIEYKVPPDERRSAEGTRIATCGVTMPLETLHRGTGDCDTKCFLLASVLSGVDNLPAVFLEGEHHMFIGVACPPRPGDRYVTVQGIDFVLIETTAPWPIGAIPRSIENGLQANLYQVTPLNPEP